MRIDRRASAQLAACAAAAALAAALSGCGQENRYVAPPPPKVSVAIPVQQKVTRYLEATGYTSAINTTNLVARVQGFLEKINYKDGDEVKEGATLFVIEPEPYKLKLEQARAAEAGAQASLKQAEAEFERQSELASRQVTSKQALDNATANRDSARARLKQAEIDTAQAALNLGYTEVKAPFDGIVTARRVSLGELVGANGPTQLATIVQTAPVYAAHKPALISHGFLRFLANLA
jgi:RND family efflux transporter MFP subunit